MLLNLPIEEISEKYLNGMSTVELAKEYKCSYPTIRNRLINNGIKIRSKSECHIGRNIKKEHHAYIDLPIEEISEKYLNGMNTVELAKEYRCSKSTIRDRLINNKIELRHKIDLPTEKICEKYLNGINIKELAKEYNCSPDTIRRQLRDTGIKIRSNSEVRTKKLAIEEISEKYLNGMNTVELAKEYKCSSCVIARRLISNGIKIRSNSESQIGKNVSIESRQHLSAAHQDIPYDEWKDFVKDQPYCSLFNEKFKTLIRNSYHNKCFICGKTKEENGKNLDVHHVNYNKDCLCGSPCEFVPLCRSCHSKTNHNRKYWEDLIMHYLYPERYFMVD